MATGKRRGEEIPVNIKEVLTDDEFGYDAKLQAVQELKDIFKPPDKIFGNMRLESLLQSARIALKTKMPDKDFLFNYGTTLAGFIGRDATLNSELLYQMEHVLAELKKLDGYRADALGAMLWNRLEENSIIYSSAALNSSKQIIEKMVLDWLNSAGNPRLEFPARMAAASRELFQKATAVLYAVLVRSRGHGKVLEVTRSFIGMVMSICGKEGKDFLRLYPKDCRRLVSFLMVDPEVFSQNGRIAVNNVNSLLSEMFFGEKYKALILLSHYSEWVRPFGRYLSEIGAL